RVALLRNTGRRHSRKGRVPAEIRKSCRREPSAGARSPPTKARPSTAMPTVLRSRRPQAPAVPGGILDPISDLITYPISLTPLSISGAEQKHLPPRSELKQLKPLNFFNYLPQMKIIAASPGDPKKSSSRRSFPLPAQGVGESQSRDSLAEGLRFV